MNERLRKLRKTLDLTQEKFGARLRVKGNTIAQWESGRNAPPDSAISFICHEFNVNESWLRDGSGEMFAPDDELRDLAAKYGLSEDDRILIKKYIGLKSSARDVIVDFIKDVSAALDSTPDKFDNIPKTPEGLEQAYPVNPVEKDEVG